MTRSDDEWFEAETQNVGQAGVEKSRIDPASDVVIDGYGREN